jgi:hypothetical protein
LLKFVGVLFGLERIRFWGHQSPARGKTGILILHFHF